MFSRNNQLKYVCLVNIKETFKLSNYFMTFFRYEDMAALDGGEDGLQIIKSILRFSQQILNMDGKIFLEVDPSHPEMIKDFLKSNTDLQLTLTHVHKDFLGRERFVEIKRIHLN